MACWSEGFRLRVCWGLRLKPLGVCLLVSPGRCTQLWDLSLNTWREALWEFALSRQAPVAPLLQSGSIAGAEDHLLSPHSLHLPPVWWPQI